jgi:hypothetical protein
MPNVCQETTHYEYNKVRLELVSDRRRGGDVYHTDIFKPMGSALAGSARPLLLISGDTTQAILPCCLTYLNPVKFYLTFTLDLEHQDFAPKANKDAFLV